MVIKNAKEVVTTWTTGDASYNVALVPEIILRRDISTKRLQKLMKLFISS